MYFYADKDSSMKQYPDRKKAATEIIEIGRRMYEKDYVAANDGNISCKIAPDVILATPTGVSKGFMTEDMLVTMSTDGSVISMGELKPSSEVKMHLRVYKENPDVMGVTHAHPLTATSFAIAGIPLDEPILTETIMSLGNVPVARYGTPGTTEVPDSIGPFCRGYNAALLSNHGVITWGDSLMQAYFRLEAVEYYAKIILNTKYVMGAYRRLSEKQIDDLLVIRNNLGVGSGGVPQYVKEPCNDKDIMPHTGEIKE